MHTPFFAIDAAAFQTLLMEVSTGLLAALCGVAVVVWLAKSNLFKGWTSRNWFGRGAFLLAALVATFVQSKVINNASHDEDINFLDMEFIPITSVSTQGGVTVTNVVGMSLDIHVGPGSAVPTPIWFRDSSASNWVNLVESETGWDAEMPYLVSSGEATNTYRIVNNVMTNEPQHSQWHLGLDLPAVEIEYKDAIKILDVETTAFGVTLTWQVSQDIGYTDLDECIVEYSPLANNAFVEVGRVPVTAPQTFTAEGFYVGKKSYWRVRMVRELLSSAL